MYVSILYFCCFSTLPNFHCFFTPLFRFTGLSFLNLTFVLRTFLFLLGYTSRPCIHSPALPLCHPLLVGACQNNPAYNLNPTKQKRIFFLLNDQRKPCGSLTIQIIQIFLFPCFIMYLILRKSPAALNNRGSASRHPFPITCFPCQKNVCQFN